MAHVTLHFAAGFALGTAVALPRVLRAWRRGGPLTHPFARWLAFAYGLGIVAVVPNLARRAGCPEWFCAGPWMNLFVLHPLLDALIPRQWMPLGAAALGAALAGPYLMLLTAIRRRHCQRKIEPPAARNPQ